MLRRGFPVLRLLYLTLFALAAASGARAQPAGVDLNELQIARVASAPTLDAILSGHAPPATVSDFRQRQPGDGLRASLETRAYLSYDDRNLYVIFECRDDPQHIRAQLARRENIGSDDRVVLYLDTFRDRRRAYVFEVNALGIQRDGILTEGAGTDYSYDALWRSEGKLTADGFAVLLAIPFKSLRFSNDDAQVWGIGLGRHIPRNSESSYWPLITARIEGVLSQLGIVQGLKGVSSGHNMQVVPYAATTDARYLDTRAAAFARASERRGGVDMKVVTSNGATIDATVNPDFSQIESDAPQVTVNSRFEVFFPERRPFFVENAGVFSTPEVFVFSRRIVNPQLGVRLTGKAGKWAFGGLVADDRAQGSQLPVNGQSLGARAVNAVVRVQRDIGKWSTIGALVTDRESGASSSRLAATDFRLKLSPTWILTGQAARSDNTRPDDTRRRGAAVKMVLERTGRNLTYSSTYRELSPQFDAALGFIQRVNLRQTNHYLSYFRRSDRGLITWFGPSLSGLMDWNYEGIRQDWSLSPAFEIALRGGSGISVYRTSSYQRLDDHEFRERANVVSAYGSSRVLRVDGSLSWGTAVNYSPPAGGAPYLGSARGASFGLTFYPSQRLTITESYYFSGLRVLAGTAHATVGAAIFRNHISRTRFALQITQALSIRAIVDYNALVSDSSLIAQDTTKRLTGDALLTYLVNPFTALYVGYTEGRENLDIVRNDPPTLRTLVSPTTPVLRQLFIKLSYRLGL
ncbi:MAG: DUF5916 domain-containing protein [Vicinamibacterales bacterium]